MGGLVSYFSRGGWKGNGSESVQDLVGEQHGETSLTNPLFTLNKSSPTHLSKPSEMVSLPPDSSSPINSSRKSSPPGPDNTDHDHEVTVHVPIDEVDFQPSTVDDGRELFVEKDIVITPLEDGDRFQEINTLVSSILRIYKPIAERRVLIKKGIIGFKEELGLSSSSTFIKCFSTIRAKVPNSMRVELLCAGTEPIKLKIEEVVPGQSPSSSDQHVLSEDVRKSIMALNSALGFCQKYKGEKELKHADIQCKLDDLHLMPLARDGQVLFDACNCAPSYLEEILFDIEKFHQQLYEARNLLRLS